MKLLRIESTKFTPGIILDPGQNVLEFYGFSLPENSIDFYTPVTSWLQEYKELLSNSLETLPQVQVFFKLVYYNSSSLRQLVDIFQIISEIYHMGIPVNVQWQYDGEDPSMAENGKELGDIVKMPVNVVAFN